MPSRHSKLVFAVAGLLLLAVLVGLALVISTSQSDDRDDVLERFARRPQVSAVLRSYELGVNSFIIKPVTFAGLVEVMQGFSRYWFEIVELPTRVSV
jgi:hypothetical protein